MGLSARSGARVAMVLSNDFSSDPRVEKEALALLEEGHRVTVVAWGRSGTLPAEEVRAGVDVVRTGRVAPYGAGLRNLTRFRQFWTSAEGVVAKLRPDVVHCHDLDTARVGLAHVRRAPGTRLVLDLHEMYVESNMMPKMPLVGAVARFYAGRLERRALAAADLVVLANPGFERFYRDSAAGRMIVVENAPELERYKPVSGSRTSESFRVCYIGQKRYVESLRRLMEAVQQDPRLSAYIAGGGSAEAEVQRLADRFERVDVEGRLDYADIAGRYEGCDAVYVVYDPSLKNLRWNLPVKVMEAMAVGLPVVVGSGTWVAEFVERERVGLSVDARDTNAIASALLRLADAPQDARSMGARGRAVVEAGLNWENAAKRLTEAYRRLLAGDAQTR